MIEKPKEVGVIGVWRARRKGSKPGLFAKSGWELNRDFKRGLLST